MRFISWNVNGLRACMQKGFMDYFNAVDADCFCIQETKLQEGQLQLDLQGYAQYWNYAEKKGYSGTAIISKTEPISVHYGLDVAHLDTEGRLITLEFPDYYGYSWDAFWDFLNEPFCESIYIEILGIDVIERLFDDDAKMLLSTLKEWKHFGTDHDEDIRIEIVRGDERIEIDDYPIAE